VNVLRELYVDLVIARFAVCLIGTDDIELYRLEGSDIINTII
jgi:hypothetical protein